jgi:hypothetical protein
VEAVYGDSVRGGKIVVLGVLNDSITSACLKKRISEDSFVHVRMVYLSSVVSSYEVCAVLSTR